MCDVHDIAPKTALTRRGFAGLATGAAALTLMPLRAKASGNVEAMGVTCIDYRLVDDAVRFFDGLGLTNEYDALALAGASLAAVSPKFPKANAAFWDQLAISKELHHIKKVILLDHRDCGAYKVAFGKEFAGRPQCRNRAAQIRHGFAESRARPDASRSRRRVLPDGARRQGRAYPVIEACYGTPRAAYPAAIAGHIVGEMA